MTSVAIRNIPSDYFVGKCHWINLQRIMIYLISIWLLPVLIAITFHEAAHAYVARFLGDDTASQLGRVSLNPLRHIDPFGHDSSSGTSTAGTVAFLVRVCQTCASELSGAS